VGKVEAALGSHWGIEPQKAKLLARLCHGCLGWAVSAVSDAGMLQQRADRIERLLAMVEADYEERFAYVAEMATQFSRNRESVYEVLDLWLDWWRDLLLIKADNGDSIANVDFLATLAEIAQRYSLAQIRSVIGNIQEVKKQLRQNANAQLALEVLMLNIPRKERAARKVSPPNLR